MGALTPEQYENLFQEALETVSAENASIEELRIVLANTIVENAIKAQAAGSLQDSFNELYEKYQTRDKVFQAAWATAQDDHQSSIMAMHEKHTKILADKWAECTREFTREKLNAVVKTEFVVLAKPLITDAHIAGQKDNATAKGQQAAYKRHEKTRQLKAEAFAWFDANAADFPRNMTGCATAAFKAVGIEVSTAMTYLREWKKSKRPNL